MFAAGKCWKRDGWIISMYKALGDPYKTMKAKKLKLPAEAKNESCDC